MKQSVLAIFVKTPELSPVKTRLAASIGHQSAVQFFELALSATAAIAREAKRQLPGLEVVWAVAEKEALSLRRWNQFPTVFQGEGGLGDRLHHVYESLLQNYSSVSFVGADSPHLNLDKLVDALASKQHHPKEGFVLGRTEDGGFYFFGGSLPLPRETWTAVEYSSAQTAIELADGLELIGPVDYLDEDFDVDVVDDLRRLAKLELSDMPEQRALIEWARTFL